MIFVNSTDFRFDFRWHHASHCLCLQLIPLEMWIFEKENKQLINSLNSFPWLNTHIFACKLAEWIDSIQTQWVQWNDGWRSAAHLTALFSQATRLHALQLQIDVHRRRKMVNLIIFIYKPLLRLTWVDDQTPLCMLNVASDFLYRLHFSAFEWKTKQKPLKK